MLAVKFASIYCWVCGSQKEGRTLFIFVPAGIGSGRKGGEIGAVKDVKLLRSLLRSTAQDLDRIYQPEKTREVCFWT